MAQIFAVQFKQPLQRRPRVGLCCLVAVAAFEDALEEVCLNEGLNAAGPGEEDERLGVVEPRAQLAQLAQPFLRPSHWLDHTDERSVNIVAATVDEQPLLQPAEANHDDIGVPQGAQGLLRVECLISHEPQYTISHAALPILVCPLPEAARPSLDVSVDAAFDIVAERSDRMRRSPNAVRPHRSAEQADAFRTLFRQQGDRLWNADRDVDWSAGSTIPAARRAAWLRMMNVFLGLEVMGLDTIQVMMSQATHQLRDPALNLYLAAQCQDEARHVYALDRYLTEVDGHGYLSTPERFLIERFGGMASWGFYRVENWLTSTLFSENFAALFLQQALELDDVDPLAKQIFRLILRDEVRHVNFLHTILPQLIDRLPAAGRLYVWQSQLLLASAVALGLRRIKQDVADLGIDVDRYKSTLLENLDVQFQDAGLDSFLKIDTYAKVFNAVT